jgi:hypothetical protein
MNGFATIASDIETLADDMRESLLIDALNATLPPR